MYLSSLRRSGVVSLDHSVQASEKGVVVSRGENMGIFIIIGFLP